MWTPLKRRLIVFQVPSRERFEGSTLYRANPKARFLERVQDCWILSIGIECKYDWKQGQHILVDDGLELDPTELDLWEENKNLLIFSGLKSLVERYGGKVETSIIHEGAVMAEVFVDQFISGQMIGEYK